MSTLAQADEKIHSVVSQWHYPILIKHGYLPITLSAKGLVRSYIYKHRVTEHTIRTVTGVNSDYWIDDASGEQGYWSQLEPHLRQLNSLSQ